MKESTKLKVKFTSLSEEQRIIRSEEIKEIRRMEKWRAKARLRKAQAELAMKPYTGPMPDQLITDTNSLYLHRMGLRKEIRSTHLASSFLRGTPYFSVENFSWTQPDWNRVQRLAVKYSGQEEQIITQRFAEWMQDALQGCQPYMVDRDLRHPGSSRAVDNWVRTRPGYTPAKYRR